MGGINGMEVNMGGINFQRISKVEIDEADETTREVYLDFMKTNGSPDVCSISKVLGHWPVLLKSKWIATKAIMYEQGKLSRRLKNGIGLVIAVAKGSEERIQFYAHALKKDGLTDEEIKAIIRTDQEFLPEKDYHILRYTLKSSSEPLRVTDMDFDELKELGISNWELVEMQETITRACYYVNFSNTLNLSAEPWYSGFELGDNHPSIPDDYKKDANYWEYIDQYGRMVTKFAEKNRSFLKLNPDAERVEDLLDGLARNRIEFGKAYCPCMVARISKDESENRKRICPCAFHQKDIESQGMCECGMFLGAS